MEVIVLAGGKGTRLRAVVSELPKPMAPVNNKPFLHYVLKWLKKYPVTGIIMSVGYKAETISDYFGDNFEGIPIKYVLEKTPLGTGGAINYSLSYAANNEVLIINADTYFPIDLNKFISFHQQSGAKLSVGLKKMENFDRYGTVEMAGHQIVKFNEKQFCQEGLINGGVYLVNKLFIDAMHLPEVFSFETEVLEKQTSTGALKGLEFDDTFIDIGIPEDYYRASEIV